MAKRQFMSNGPSGRDRRKKSARAAARKSVKNPHRPPTKCTPATETDFESFESPLEEAIENERERLSQAQAILGCLHMVLEDPDEDGDDAPYYPYLIDMAQKLVREAVNRLDSVYLGPLINGRKAASKSSS